MDILQVNPANKKQVHQFLDLPFRIYKDNPCWVPPLELDMGAITRPQKHPFYKYGEASFFLAMRNRRAVGRIALIKNQRYIDFNHDPAAFFYWFECENDPEAAAALFETAFAWARARGLTRLLGPKGFPPLDGGGILVEGFNYRPAFGMPYNPPYYPSLIEAAGFTQYRESVSGRLDRSIQFPQRIHDLAERVRQRRGLRIATYKNRRDLRALIPKLKDLYNGALGGTQGNVPLDDDDVNALADQLLWFADPRLVKIVMKGDEPVGFLLAYPNITAGLQKTKGRLFPFGWLTLLWELRTTPWVDINGAGLLEEYRGSGSTAILFSEMFKTAQMLPRFQYAEVVQIGVENDAMQREMQNFGIHFHKKHRVYQKDL